MPENEQPDRQSDKDSLEPDPQQHDAHVLDHFEDPYHRGPFEYPTHAAEAEIPVCGDSIRIELQVVDDTVQQAWFDGDGCVVSQSAASMLMEKIEGMSIQDLADFSPQEMLTLYGPTLVANRQKCCLLSWRVLQSAIEQPVFDDDSDDVANFGGPSLSEEC